MKKILKKFGKYLLLDRLAQGGMAEIFRAWLPSVDGGGRLMVLKCVQAGLGEDQEFLQMFQSEIRVTMGLNHPNIVQLYDFGEIEDRPFIAMELVEGKNLKQLATRAQQLGNPLLPEFCVQLITQAAAGLHYAHTYKEPASGTPLNIIHRDISPQNLLVSYEGNLKIIDFGIAKATSNRQTTQAGIIKGKPSYLSPEQIDGEVLDGRSDVFSLGAVLWELLAGRKLFAGKSDIDVIRMIQDCSKTVVPPSSINPNVPKELDKIVLKSLTQKRDDRFKNAEEMQRTLHRFLYAYKPDFDPSDFAKYIQGIFKDDMLEEQKSVREFNMEAKELLEIAAAAPDEPSLTGKSKRTSSAVFKMESQSASIKIDLQASPKTKKDLPSLRESPYLEAVTGTRIKARAKEAEKKSSSSFGNILLLLLIAGGAGAYLYPDTVKSLIAQVTGGEPHATAPAATSARAPVANQPAAQPPAQSVATAPDTQPATPPPAGMKILPVEISIVPAGGPALQAALDDKPVNLQGLELPPGHHTLKLTKQGFTPISRDLDVAPGFAAVHLNLALEPSVYGTLNLTSTPTAEARISQNDMVWQSPTPVKDLKLPPGEYQIHLVNQLLGMQKDVKLQIQQGKVASQDLVLEVVH
jgi:serine/threonine-protein kinase